MTTSSDSSSIRPQGDDITLRGLRAADRAPLETILRDTDAFTEEEIDVALELIDCGITGSDPDYRFVVAESAADGVIGYSCFGLTPLTDGVYDLYWIAVAPRLHGKGAGRKILAGSEAEVRRLGGRMILIETASKPSYAATRAFYERTGYEIFARLPDYYCVGDDKLIYGKRV